MAKGGFEMAWCKDCTSLDRQSLMNHLYGCPIEKKFTCPYQKGECMYPNECPDCSQGEEE